MNLCPFSFFLFFFFFFSFLFFSFFPPFFSFLPSFPSRLRFFCFSRCRALAAFVVLVRSLFSAASARWPAVLLLLVSLRSFSVSLCLLRSSVVSLARLFCPSPCVCAVRSLFAVSVSACLPCLCLLSVSLWSVFVVRVLVRLCLAWLCAPVLFLLFSCSLS